MQFLWHDYETFGTQPAVDRPCQFAAQRTDTDLNPVGEPVEWYCAPADDVLPHPSACLVTGITPQIARERGTIEAEFSRAVQALMSEPGTCSVGYNSLKFDDEVTRNLFYRNLLDPYEREWKNGNSRWDLINLTRMCYALRPEGIEWPMVEVAGEGEQESGNGGAGRLRPSFRLQDLTEANRIAHEDAHNALADVRATLALAQLIRKAQPRLFDWALGLRNKQQARGLLNFESAQPVVHTSGRIPAARGCTSLVLPLASHPDNDKAVIVFDLMGDARTLVESDADMIRDLVFTPSADLPDEVSRLPLKAVKWNAVPMLAPASVLTGVDLSRIGLDLARCEENEALIKRHLHSVRRSVSGAFHNEFDDGDIDPDLALYGGGFFSDADRRVMQAIQRCTPEELGEESWEFQDPRLPLMLLRYRARNWPDTLTPNEWNAWLEDRNRRLGQPPGSPIYGLADFNQELSRAREQGQNDPQTSRILDALEAWSTALGLEEHIKHL